MHINTIFRKNIPTGKFSFYRASRISLFTARIGIGFLQFFYKKKYDNVPAKDDHGIDAELL
jgi:hypothetical protein